MKIFSFSTKIIRSHMFQPGSSATGQGSAPAFYPGLGIGLTAAFLIWKNKVGTAFTEGSRSIALACALLLGGSAYAQAPIGASSDTPRTSATKIPAIALSDLKAPGMIREDVSVISDALANSLQKTGKFRVMERSQMDQILKEQNFQASGACDGSQCAIEIGKLVGLDRMVVGSIGLIGNTYSMNLRLVDVGTGEAIRTSTRTMQGSIDRVLTEMVPDAARELAGEAVAERPVTPSPRRIPAKVEGSSNWGWWVAGGLVLAGGASAGIWLLKSKSTGNSSTTPTLNASDVHAVMP